MARVPYTDPEDLPEEYRDLLFISPEGGDETANVFRAIGNNPPVLDSFRKYFGVLWTESGLTERERELVILVTARQIDAAYIWHQHVRLAREAGISADEIRTVSTGTYAGFPPTETTLLRYAEAVVTDAIDEALYSTVSDTFDHGTIVGITMLATGYVGLARALASLNVQPREQFVGWALAKDDESG